MEKLRILYAGNSTEKITQAIVDGVELIDVRARSEYYNGHVRGSINIPLDVLGSNLAKFKDKNTPIITCCASGMRSASAASLLKSKGYTQVYNGGGWMSLQRNL